MRKFIVSILMVAMLLFSFSTITNCYGKYILVKKVHKWNGSTFSNKFVKSIVWFPVQYIGGGIGLFIDYIILNPLEFWTGSNPLAMGADDKAYLDAHHPMHKHAVDKVHELYKLKHGL